MATLRHILKWALRTFLALVALAVLLFLGLVVWYYVLWPTDRSLLTGDPCAPPCWQNLTPGVSTDGDVQTFLDSLPDMERSRVVTISEGCDTKTYQWRRAGSGALREVTLRKYVVSLISVDPELFSMPLGDVVDHLGPPEYVDARVVLGDDGSIYFLTAYYPQRGLTLEFSPKDRERGQIKRNMQIDTIYYAESGDLLTHLTAVCMADCGYVCVEDAERRMAFSIQPWPGFGPFEVAVSGMGQYKPVSGAVGKHAE